MNCQQVDKYLYEYCDNTLNPLQRAEFDQHLKYCASCRIIVDDAIWEGTVLREEWPAPALADDFTARIMNQIADKAIQEPLLQASKTSFTSSQNSSNRIFKLIAMTAVLLLALYIPVIFNNQDVKLADLEQASKKQAINENNPGQLLENSKRLDMMTAEEQNKIHASNLNKMQNQSPSVPATDNSGTSNNPQNETRSDGTSLSMEPILMLAETPATPETLPVQPANLPASYVLLNKIDGTGSATYTYGTAKEGEKLTINIAQLPLRQQDIPAYSRGQIGKSKKSEAVENADLTSGKAIPKLSADEQSADSLSVPAKEDVVQPKADLTVSPVSNSIAYEVEHNSQRYLLTISASLSPEELNTLSHDLKLVEPNQAQ